jgi:RNA polymerase sigma-70 factor (ECF subfamily)
MRNLTFSDVDRLERCVDTPEVTLQMDEEAFAAFYERTSRPVWLYLRRLTGSAPAADDLLQEAYYRFLRADRTYASDAHRRNYLFRIATNLAHDGRRRQLPSAQVPDGAEAGGASSPVDETGRAVQRADLSRAWKRLKPRERALIWLAYAHGSSHDEIAESLGVKPSSIKLLLFRARRSLAALLNPTKGREG